MTSTDGRTLLDFAAGIGVVSTGHAHPTVTAAVAAQAARQVNAQQNLFAGSVPLARLLDRLLPLLPPSLRDGRLFFANSGSEGEWGKGERCVLLCVLSLLYSHPQPHKPSRGQRCQDSASAHAASIHNLF